MENNESSYLEWLNLAIIENASHIIILEILDFMISYNSHDIFDYIHMLSPTQRQKETKRYSNIELPM